MFKKIKSRLNKKGFTLIELIVVIAILAALAALALPTMSGIITNADKRVAEANARTVYTAAQVYFVQNPDAKDATQENLEALIGEGMTGNYKATGEGGNCKTATWIGEKYESIYDPTNTSNNGFSTTDKNSKSE